MNRNSIFGFALGAIAAGLPATAKAQVQYGSPTETKVISFQDGQLKSLSLKTPDPSVYRVEETSGNQIEITAVISGEDKSKTSELMASFNTVVAQEIAAGIANHSKELSIEFGGVTHRAGPFTTTNYKCARFSVGQQLMVGGACVDQIIIKIPKQSATTLTFNGKPVGTQRQGTFTLAQLGEQLENTHFDDEKQQTLETFLKNNQQTLFLISDVATVAAHFDFDDAQTRALSSFRGKIAREAPRKLGEDLKNGLAQFKSSESEAKLKLIGLTLESYKKGERVLSVQDIASLTEEMSSFDRIELVKALRGRATNPEQAEAIRDSVGHFDGDDAVAALAQ